MTEGVAHLLALQSGQGRIVFWACQYALQLADISNSDPGYLEGCLAEVRFLQQFPSPHSVPIWCGAEGAMVENEPEIPGPSISAWLRGRKREEGEEREREREREGGGETERDRDEGGKEMLTWLSTAGG
jgi:hypothetical protein